MAVSLAPENTAVVAFLSQAIATLQSSGRPRSCSCHVEEFGDCKYFLSIGKEQPDALHLSFTSAHTLPDEAFQAVRDAYAAVADLLTPPREGFQLTLQVSLAKLLRLEESGRLSSVQQLARVRAIATGASLRSWFQELAGGNSQPAALTVHARPRAPFFVCPADGAAVVVLPIWLKNRTTDILTMAFVQEFAEARRAAGLTTVPQCNITFPGHDPPLPLSEQQRQQLGTFKGGFLTLAVQPCHVTTPGAREALVWSLLTFYAFLDFHMRSFKVCIHTHMRKTADSLLAEVTAARTRPKQPLRLAAPQGVAAGAH